MNNTFFKTKEAKRRHLIGSMKGNETRKKRFRDKYKDNLNFCLLCKSPIPYEKRMNRFCSSSCAATYNNKRKQAKAKKCIICGKEYFNKSANSKYCGLTCFNIPRKVERIMTKCDYCHNEYEIKKTKYQKTDHHFCSKGCVNLFFKENPKLRGTWAGYNGKSTLSVYRKKAFEILEAKCRICGYTEYVSLLQVHHKDGNRKNNKIENLEILCPTHHGEIHLLTLNNHADLVQSAEHGFRNPKMAEQSRRSAPYADII